MAESVQQSLASRATAPPEALTSGFRRRGEEEPADQSPAGPAYASAG